MQNGRLIAGSIYENVAIACPNLTLDEVEDMCWENSSNMFNEIY